MRQFADNGYGCVPLGDVRNRLAFFARLGEQGHNELFFSRWLIDRQLLRELVRDIALGVEPAPLPGEIADQCQQADHAENEHPGVEASNRFELFPVAMRKKDVGCNRIAGNGHSDGRGIAFTFLGGFRDVYLFGKSGSGGKGIQNNYRQIELTSDVRRNHRAGDDSTRKINAPHSFPVKRLGVMLEGPFHLADEAIHGRQQHLKNPPPILPGLLGGRVRSARNAQKI